MAAVMKIKRWTFKDTLLHVRRARSAIEPNPECLLQLMDYEVKLFGKASYNKGSFKLSIKEFGGSYPSLDLDLFESPATDS
jgi:hypothetical protein